MSDNPETPRPPGWKPLSIPVPPSVSETTTPPVRNLDTGEVVAGDHVPIKGWLPSTPVVRDLTTNQVVTSGGPLNNNQEQVDTLSILPRRDLVTTYLKEINPIATGLTAGLSNDELISAIREKRSENNKT